MHHTNCKRLEIYNKYLLLEYWFSQAVLHSGSDTEDCQQTLFPVVIS